MPPVLEARQVAKLFAKDNHRIVALESCDLVVKEGTFVALLGRSGCGKSTLLNLFAGLSRPSSGQILLRGAALSGPCPGVGYLTQSDTLMPWRKLHRNIELPLELRGVERAERKRRSDQLIEMVGLKGHEGHYPRELSGGMRRRASLARMLISDPGLLLLDEPFGALDAQLRAEMQAELLRLWQGSGRSVVFVTHDIEEALVLGDRVVVLGERGQVRLDVAVPLERPRDLDDIRVDPDFVNMHRQLNRALKGGRDDVIPAT
ncbi:ABC transporter ATP-binding protein [Acidiferrimicrobium sp. IK]|uniref:ABC transporter ATP-binding protein n=1 Tax=Acidiferrimicrobium sp. IK TaxID=2871700 RepID=UPI0021CB601B|nr:ABC transporter ATP-binding protein [Acidiferrimicrobium sp. IK]MCU4184220.1 ABC transporter ATP-binding protein [Acidiferrimicrobium sp. IK]